MSRIVAATVAAWLLAASSSLAFSPFDLPRLDFPPSDPPPSATCQAGHDCEAVKS